MITQKQLKEQLKYNFDTGRFTRLTTASGNAKIGMMDDSIAATGYRRISILGKRYLSHRLVWLYITGSFPNGVIDHIDGDKLNNRIHNLRDVSRLENNKNKKMSKYNTTGHNGVSVDKKSGRYVSYTTVNNRYKFLGHSDTLDEAIEKRAKSNIELNFHKNHGRLNDERINN